MEVILLDNVIGLGQLGDKANVKPGYARNFLIPQGKAARATKANLERFEAERAELERKQAERLSAAQKRADAFAGVELQVDVKAGDEGKLFGSVEIGRARGCWPILAHARHNIAPVGIARHGDANAAPCFRKVQFDPVGGQQHTSDSTGTF